MKQAFFLLSMILFSNTSFAQLNYADLNNWAFHPNKTGTLIDGFNLDIAVIDENLNTTSTIQNTNNAMTNTGVDVFFVHPTILVNMASYTTVENVPLANQNANFIALSIRGQAGLLAKYGRMFAPRYNQATPPTFITSPTDTVQANVIGVAYNDIKAAFLHYLNNFNNGNKIIIASHSQGAFLTSILLRDVIDSNPQILGKLVVAVTAGIPSNYADQNATTGGWWQDLPFCTTQEQCACVMTWRSYLDGQIPPVPNNSHPALNPTIVSNDWVYTPMNLSHDWLFQDSVYYANVYSSLQNFITLKSNVSFGGNVGYVAFDDMYQIKHFRHSSNQVGFSLLHTPKPNDQRPDFLLDEQSNPLFSSLGYHQKDYNIYIWALMQQIDLKLSSCILGNSEIDKLDNSASIYPNPTSGKVMIEMESTKDFRLSVYNQMGQIICVFENQKEIDLGNLENGIYILTLQTLVHTHAQRIIKMD
jgi:Protein of unknown function (DUF3089)/Secretion system C-terminal sorting domain